MKKYFLLCLFLISAHGFSQALTSKEITHDDAIRNYLYYQPIDENLDATKSLIVVLHGAGSDAAYTFETYAWKKMADESGVRILLPNGIEKSWNNGLKSILGNKPTTDDASFINECIKDIKEEFAFEKVYIVGYSGGAMMAYRFIAEHPGSVDAASIISGSLEVPVDTSNEPVPVFQVHGTADPLVNHKYKYLSVLFANTAHYSIDEWSKVNQCTFTDFKDGLYIEKYSYQYKDCIPQTEEGALITYYEISGYTHKAPIEVRVEMTPYIWDFFKKY